MEASLALSRHCTASALAHMGIRALAASATLSELIGRRCNWLSGMSNNSQAAIFRVVESSL
ncbi:hypothetical protein M758_9G092300 [Ceratodon purpureus]|nr:hypothetical protein M758_9G092300 [Ceratodon purpureus]